MQMVSQIKTLEMLRKAQFMEEGLIKAWTGEISRKMEESELAEDVKKRLLEIIHIQRTQSEHHKKTWQEWTQKVQKRGEYDY
jgi:hypothetical protein